MNGADHVVKFRPTDDPRNKAIEGDPNPHSPVEWEDNAISNMFAWGSHKFLPNWCQTPEHFSSRFANYLWTDCPCCLIWRGVTVGFVVGVLLTLLATAIVLLLQ